MFKLAIMTLVAAAALSLATIAPATVIVTLPNAANTATCGVPFAQPIVDPVGCATALNSANVSYTPTPTLSAFAENGVGANDVLTYNFEVVGGQAGDRVHLDVATLLHWATTGNNPNSYAFARVIVTTNLGEVTANICTITCGVGSGVADYNGTLFIDALSGAINSVYMDVYASTVSIATTASALADPIISIDPQTPNAGAYSLLFSPGVGNGESVVVPEPATIGLMGIALAGLGFSRRKKV